MGTNFAYVGRLLAAPARSAMLEAMIGGRPLSAGELAAVAGVAASTASEHLGVLVAGGLVRQRSSGRHRYYELADRQVAEALEALGQLCPGERVRSLRQSRSRHALSIARTCYDHLAGRLGVELHDAYVRQSWLDGGSLAVTSRGRRGFNDLGIDLDAIAARRRPLTRPCLDWTERRTHVAGALGAALADAYLSRQWVRRRPADRALTITAAGAAGFADAYGIDLARP